MGIKQRCKLCFLERELIQEATGREYYTNDEIICQECSELMSFFSEKQVSAMRKMQRNERLTSTERVHFYRAKHQYHVIFPLFVHFSELKKLFKDRKNLYTARK